MAENSGLTMGIKMYCIFARTSIEKMKGNRGKLAAQAGHAYLHAWWDSIRPRLSEHGMDVIRTAMAYKEFGNAVKICLVVDDVDDLRRIRDAYVNVCGTSLVVDAGRTCFDGVPTTTCLGVGPIKEADIGDDLKELKVLM